MVDALWGDDSEFQIPLDERYSYRSIFVRSNDGTYQDGHYPHNLALSKHFCDTAKFDWFGTYLVYEPNWLDTFNTFAHEVGKPHPKMAAMIDMESWGGRLSGNQSTYANALRKEIAGWFGSYMSPAARAQGKHWKRVGGYFNGGDGHALWPDRPKDMWVGLANYSSNPDYPGKLFHQFSSSYNVAPFGPSDINSADGMSYLQVAKAMGLDTTPSVKPVLHPPKPTPAPTPISTLEDDTVFIAYISQEDCKAANVQWPGMFLTDLMTLKPIRSSNDLDNFRKAGVKDLPQPMSLKQYYALGGK